MFRPNMLAIPAAVIIGALAIVTAYVATEPGDAAAPSLGSVNSGVDADVEAGGSEVGSASEGATDSNEGGVFSNVPRGLGDDGVTDSGDAPESDDADDSDAADSSGAGSDDSDSDSDSNDSNDNTDSDTDDSDSDSDSDSGDAGSGDSDTDTDAGGSGGGTSTPPESEPTAPVFSSFSVSDIDPCPAVGPQPDQPVTVSWSVQGADSIYLAIDNEFGPYESGLAASGSLEVPGPGCIEPNTYYVVAENSVGRTVRQKTRTPVIEEAPVEPEPDPVEAPSFASFSVSAVERCDTAEGPAPGPVTVSWSVEGADSIYVAIDNEFGAYQDGLAASGSLQVPGPSCFDDNTYYVVAENEGGRVVKQMTRSAKPQPDSLVGS